MYTVVLFLLITQPNGSVFLKPYLDYGAVTQQFCQQEARNLNQRFNKRFPSIKYTCMKYPETEI